MRKRRTDVEGELLGRMVEIARIFKRHNLVGRKGRAGNEAARAGRLRAALEELGPTFAKLGQILSTRPDLVPPVVAVELALLQDRVSPMNEAEVVAVMEEELGVPWEDVFESIDARPIAAGTIGQVHRARLEDGDEVVVKVQRPTAAHDIRRDLGLLERFAEKASARPALRGVVDIPGVIETLSDSLERELDFRLEAENMARIRTIVEAYPRLAIPRVYEQLSTGRLLVTEFVDGGPCRLAPEGDERREAARQLLEAYLRQILGEGLFHADPHPGNMLWSDGRIVLLDFGMVGELSLEDRERLVLLLMAVVREDAAFLTSVLLMMAEGSSGAIDAGAIERELGALVGEVRHAALSEIEIGPLLQRIVEIAGAHELRLPASLTLAGKALSQLQLAVAELDPALDPFEVARGYMTRMMRGGLRERARPQRLAYEAQKLAVRAKRMSEAIERLAGTRPGERFQVELTGLEHLEGTIRAAARRVSLAVASGTCILGAALTADSPRLGLWVAETLGSVGGLLLLILAADLSRGRR
jgi:predicted unusual protein kinase regulating ubiquinone biosynthesis (AarF/ABC1/UbiB family)